MVTLPPMRLAVLTERYDPQPEGAASTASRIVDALLERGHAVTVLAGDARHAAADRPGLDIRTPPTGLPRSIVRLAAFTRWARRQFNTPGAAGPFDSTLSLTTLAPAAVVQPRMGLIAQRHQAAIARQPTAAGRLRRAARIKLSARQQLLRRLERATLRDSNVQRIVAISRYVARGLESCYGIADDRVELIPSGAEVPDMPAEERARWRERLRRGFGIGEDRVALVFPASEPWRKGLRPLLGALRRLVDRGLPVVLVLAGSDSYAQHALVAELGLREHVRLAGTTRRMDALYCAADVTVLPMFHDPASRSAIESLILGTPVITTVYDGASDWVAGPHVAEPRGRVLEDPADDAALAEAIAELLDPEVRRRCGEATAGLAGQLTTAAYFDRLEAVLAATRHRAGRPAALEATAATAETAEPDVEPRREARSLPRP